MMVKFATDSKALDYVRKITYAHKIKKEYVCLVIGKFPPGEIRVTKKLRKTDETLGVVVVDEKSEYSKDAETIFNLVWSRGNMSVVKCRPITGRTHQIRVHLQYLGYPILNDPLYNHWIWGNERFELGETTKNRDDVIRVIQNGITIDKIDAVNKIIQKNYEKHKEKIDSEDFKLNRVLFSKDEYFLKTPPTAGSNFDPVCYDCLFPRTPRKKYAMKMWLHAYKYKGPDWEFTAPLPDWAKPGKEDDHLILNEEDIPEFGCNEDAKPKVMKPKSKMLSFLTSWAK